MRSLPPKILGDIQGRLDFLILRPALLPPLLPSQALVINFKWWGDDQLCSAKLYPQCDEVKFIFDICCNSLGFQRYLEDAEKVDIQIIVSTDNVKDSKTQEIRGRNHHFKNKEKWINGEIVGNFVIKNLKLNSRGELVSECKITNKFGHVSGSVVVFMLYTPKLNTGIETLNAQEEDFQLLSSTKAIKSPPISLYFHSNLTESRENDEHYRMESRKASHGKISPENCSVNYVKKNEIPVSKLPNQELEEHYISNADLLEYLPDRSFLIKRLFSFVDSGAIQLADLPTLLEICEGRSPSLDFTTEQPNINLSPPIRDQKIVSEKKSYENFHQSNGQKNISILSDTSNYGIALSPHCQSDKLYYQHVSSPTKVKEVTKIKDVDNYEPAKKNSLFKNAKMCKILSPGSFKPISNVDDCFRENEEYMKFVSHSKKSLLVVYINTINLNPFDEKVDKLTKQESNKCNNFGTKKTVRQRSKICFLLQTSVHCKHENESVSDNKTSLFVSRHVENGTVIYNSSEILQLPSNSCCSKFDGYFKARVIRRRLGERLGSEVGVGIITLQKLYELREIEVLLSLYRPNIEDCKAQQLTATLWFKVAFALVDESHSKSEKFDFCPISYAHSPVLEGKELSCNLTSQCGYASSGLKTSVPKSIRKCSKLPVQCDINNQVDHETRRQKLPLSADSMQKDIYDENRCNRPYVTSSNEMEKSVELSSHKRQYNSRDTNKPRNVVQEIYYSDGTDVPITKPNELKNNTNTKRNLFSEKSLNLQSDGKANSPQHYSPPSINSPSENMLLCFQDREDNYHGAFRDKSSKRENEDTHLFDRASSQKINDSRPVIYADISSHSQKYFNGSSECNVHLEICEGRKFPMLISTQSDVSFAPNTYVKISPPIIDCCTKIVVDSVTPKWNLKTNIILCSNDLPPNQEYLIVLVFHCLSGEVPSSNDPLLGFIALDIQLLWTNFLCFSGWVPLLNKDGGTCGEIYMSLKDLGTVNNCIESSTQTTLSWNGPNESNNLSEYLSPNLIKNKHILVSKKAVATPGKRRGGSKHPERFECATSFEKGEQFYGDQSLDQYDDYLERTAEIAIKLDKQREREHFHESSQDKMLYLNSPSTNATCENALSKQEFVSYMPQPTVDGSTFIISSNCESPTEEQQNEYENFDDQEYNEEFDFLSRDNDAGEGLSSNVPPKEESIKPKTSALDKYSSITTKLKSAMEPFTWMNQLRSMDTPCASFVEAVECSATPSISKNNQREILSPILEAEPLKRKIRRSRIAANINMPKF